MVMLAQIEEKDWSIDKLHGVIGGKNKWRVLVDGIYVNNEKTPRAFANDYYKNIASTVYRDYSKDCEEISKILSIDSKILLAAICTESAGSPKASRFEIALNDWSFGLCQTLTATAFAISSRLNDEANRMLASLEYKMPNKSFHAGGNIDEWKNFLYQPKASILLGGSYFNINNTQFGLKYDPVLLYASYNAGSPRPSMQNDWGIVNYGSALQGFVNFYGNVCLLNQQYKHQEISLDTLFAVGKTD